MFFYRNKYLNLFVKVSLVLLVFKAREQKLFFFSLFLYFTMLKYNYED